MSASLISPEDLGLREIIPIILYRPQPQCKLHFTMRYPVLPRMLPCVFLDVFLDENARKAAWNVRVEIDYFLDPAVIS